MELGQKNSTESGIDTLTASPPISTSDVILISGETLKISFLNATESLANIFCVKEFIVSCFLSPSTSITL